MKTLSESNDSGSPRGLERTPGTPVGLRAGILRARGMFPVETMLVVVLAAAAMACGGKAKTDGTTKPDDTSQGSDKHEMAMPPTVVKFHDTLAPRWHAEHGPKRMADTCAAVGQLHTDADAIVAAPAPSGASAGAWTDGGKQLAEAVTALDATCQAKDAAAFEPAFERVHKTFHHVMEAAGPQHGEHDEHGDHGDHDDHKM